MKRIVELDGIRGLAIIMVLICHYITIQLVVKRGDFDLLLVLAPIINLGWTGVDLFFVLSGFLIIKILLGAKEGNSFFKTFYIRRVCRIVPLYWLLLGIYTLNIIFKIYKNSWLFEGNIPLLSYVTFTQNYFINTVESSSSFLHLSWSLAVEEQFYVVIPLLVYFIDKKWLLLFFSCVIISCPIVRFFLLQGEYDLVPYIVTHARADSICIGGCLAIITTQDKYKNTIYKISQKHFKLFYWVAFAAMLFLIAKGIKQGGVFTHTILGLVSGLIILRSIQERKGCFNKLFTNKILVWFGHRSYFLYLAHMPIIGICHDFIAGREKPIMLDIYGVIANLISFVILIILSELSFRYFESYFINFGKKYTYR